MYKRQGVQFNLGIGDSSPTVIYNRGDTTFRKLEKERIEWLEEAFSKTGPCQQTKEDVLKKASTDTSDESVEPDTTADDDMFILKQRAKKKRKLTRELCEYTGEASHGERKHKGWSDQGMVAFETYVEEIRKDVVEDNRYVEWENAYREVMRKLGHSRRTPREETALEGRYKPNHSIVYEGF